MKLLCVLFFFYVIIGISAAHAQTAFEYFYNTRQFVATEGMSVYTYTFPQKLMYQSHKAVDERLAIAYQLKQSGEQYIGLWDSRMQYVGEYNLGKLQVLDYDLQEESEDASGLVMVRYFDHEYQTEFAGIFDASMQWLGQYQLTGATDIQLSMKGINPTVQYHFKGQDWVVELASNGQALSQIEAPPSTGDDLVTIGCWEGKQGLADAQGNIVLPCIYREIYASGQPNVYIAANGGKYGTVDMQGNKISGFSYDEIGFFNQGIAPALKGDNWGFIRSDGKELTDFVYESVGNFEYGPAKARKDGRWVFVGMDGKPASNLSFEQATDFDQHGTTVVKQNGKFALFNTQIQKLSGFEFERIGRFPEAGPALAKVQQGGKWGFIDTRGNLVVPVDYSRVNDYRNGRAAVQKDGKYHFLDGNGNMLSNAEYDKVRSFRDGVAQVSKGGKSSLIGLDGKELVPFNWDRVGFKAGYGIVWVGRKQGLIDKDGSVILPPEYEMVDIIADKGNVVGFLVKKDGKRGVINAATKEIAVPLKYDNLYAMAEQGLFTVQENGLSGLFAPNGDMVAEIIYEQVKPINANLIAVKDKGGLWGFLNRYGTKITGFNYKMIGDETEGRILLNKGGKIGFADSMGQIIIPCEFEYSGTQGFQGGLYPTRVNGKEVYINKWGKVIE